MDMKNNFLYSIRFGRRKFVRLKKERILRETQTKHESFNESIEFIIGIAQYFPIFPIIGYRSPNLNDLTFLPIHARTFAAILFIFFALIEIGLGARHAIKFNFHFTSMANLIFLIESTSDAIVLLLLARRWKHFMIQWRELENCFLYEPYEMDGLNLKEKIRRTGCLYAVLGFTEHLLFVVSTLIYDYFQYSSCKFSNTTFLNFYFAKEKPHVFLYLPFSMFAAVPGYLMLLCLIFAWSFVDLFLIVISIGLITRFKQFHKRLVDNYPTIGVNSVLGPQFWTDLRYHFISLLDLLRLVDEEVSLLILLSCGSNLFSICFQIFNSFKAIPHILRRFHFWLSFFCLISRTFCVLYLGSAINEIAREILHVLRDVPTKIWNVDIQCMMNLLNRNELIALTGRKFFVVTRRIILGMAATIVTYELVIMQETTYDAEDKPVCNTTRLNFIKNNY